MQKHCSKINPVAPQGTICRLEYKWEWDVVNARYYDEPTEEKSCPHHRLTLPGDEEKRNCYLIIHEITKEDDGQWKCKVKDYGLSSEDSHLFDLRVIDMEDDETQARRLEDVHPLNHERQQDWAGSSPRDGLLDDITDTNDRIPEHLREQGNIMTTMEKDLEDLWHGATDPILNTAGPSDSIFYVAIFGGSALLIVMIIFAAIVYFPRHKRDKVPQIQ